MRAHNCTKHLLRAGGLVAAGGADRVIFRLLVDVERLEATLNYESAGAAPLASAAIEDVTFNTSLTPATLAVTASLGNLRAQDCGLPEVRARCRCCVFV